MNSEKINEEYTQVSNIPGKVDTFDINRCPEDNCYNQLFELDDYKTDDEKLIESKMVMPKLNIADKYKKVINELYKEGIIFDKNPPDLENIVDIDDTDVVELLNITADTDEDIVSVSYPFVYGCSDPIVVYNRIYFYEDTMTTTNFEEDIYDLDYCNWFSLDDIEGLKEYMFNIGVA